MESLLKELYDIVSQRKVDLPEGSYTVSLFTQGKKQIIRKVLEEASEVVIASIYEDQKAMIHELADLWYHLIVLMVQDGVTIEDVIEELTKRRR